MARIDILDPFTTIDPGQFISKYSDWIMFTLLLFFFWAVVGIALRKRFEESRHLRFLVTTVALLLAVGTYYSVYKGYLHLSLAGLGMFGAVLLFLVIFFIIIGLVRAYGVNTWTALPLGFALFYISLWAVSPNILHNLKEIFPPANLILIILFITSVVKLVMAFFHHSRSPLKAARDLAHANVPPPPTPEIDKEMHDETKETKLIKRKTMKLTKQEIKTIEDIERILNDMVHLIREKANTVDQEEIAQLTNTLRTIAKKEEILKSGLILMHRHVNAYKAIHKKDITELETRLQSTKEKKKRATIEEELTYQKRMLEVLDFLEKYETRIQQFTQDFNNVLYTAMFKVKDKYPADALSYLDHARQDLAKMKHIYEKQKNLEQYLVKLNKKTIKDLKREKKSS